MAVNSWREENRDRDNELQRLRYKKAPRKYLLIDLRRRAKEYGLDPDTMEALYLDHNGFCDICEEKAEDRDPRSRRLCMDHDHEEGHFRGFICRKCNLALGYMNDNADWLKKAAAYLERSD